MLDQLLSVGQAAVSIADRFGLFADLGGLAVAWSKWGEKRSTEAQRIADVQELAQASPQQVQKAVASVVTSTADDKSPEFSRKLNTYLTQLPATIRNVTRRSSDPRGVTISAFVRLQKLADLLPLLPTRPPKFQPGQRPLPAVDLQLVELLGVGGFGEVWKARNPHMSNVPPVALKFPPGDWVSGRCGNCFATSLRRPVPRNNSWRCLPDTYALTMELADMR